MLRLFHAWRGDWTVVVTFLGWLMLLKGAVLVVFPRPLVALAGAWSKAGAVIAVQGLVLLALGIWLSYRAFAG